MPFRQASRGRVQRVWRKTLTLAGHIFANVEDRHRSVEFIGLLKKNGSSGNRVGDLMTETAGDPHG